MLDVVWFNHTLTTYKHTNKQASKKTDFAVDLTCMVGLAIRLAPNTPDVSHLKKLLYKYLRIYGYTCLVISNA